jgi:hypothetical protein
MLLNLYVKELKKSITISVNENVDNYGNNVSAWESQTKEQREAKAPRNYVGNGTVVFSKAKEYPVAPKKEFTSQTSNEGLSDSLPF